jgi:AraC-like DNA-binding protein
MTNQKLDRLSALLEGLAPEVTLDMPEVETIEFTPVVDEPCFLWLYVVSRGQVQLHSKDEAYRIDAPALIALRSDKSYALLGNQLDKPARLICAKTRLTGPVAVLFLEEFSEPRIVALSDNEPALRLAVTMIEAELNAPRCGQPALLDRAGDILFIGILRYLVAHPGVNGIGLFNGLADPRIARALVAIHQRPASNWSLDRLASEAGMSRTAFAARFRDVMRRTPGKYLASIRLAMAQRAVDLGKGLKEAARTAGYANTSALSRALTKNRIARIAQ